MAETTPSDAPVTKAAPPAPVVPVVPKVEEFDIGDSEVAALEAIQSLPSWSAAIERYRFLERRGDAGPVHGTLVRTGAGLELIDESTGDGALSIPVAVPKGMKLSLPMRAILWGAWRPEENPSWRWHATRVARLPEGDESPPQRQRLEPFEEPQPDGIALPSAANRRGDSIAFVVKDRSSRAGDGWIIADQSGGPAVARLLLPGERETYGDQSELASDERWQLKKNTLYWLTIRSFRPPRPGELPVYRARSAPRIDPAVPLPTAAPHSAQASESAPAAAP